ncbi:hypothetical protein [Bifidobacterium sp.]|uniref:hypothetical protein n=1 Tax=Bifidobacterium sp. TaxID=41200 RepID=UPI0039E9BE79
MTNRKHTTILLNTLVEKRLRSRRMFWAPEVSFDKNNENHRRIDYVAFKPLTPNYFPEPSSVECGTFECYEVKSCMEDFRSGNGLTFYGDRNYLVTTAEFAEELRLERLTPRGINGILAPNKPCTALISAYVETNSQTISQSYRKRTASEMLWAIVRSRYQYDCERVEE